VRSRISNKAGGIHILATARQRVGWESPRPVLPSHDIPAVNHEQQREGKKNGVRGNLHFTYSVGARPNLARNAKKEHAAVYFVLYTGSYCVLNLFAAERHACNPLPVMLFALRVM
jgi:hypothetical protein